MKLLFDQNLSPRLVSMLADQYPGCAHVGAHALDQATDEVVWTFARTHDYTLVTKDSDFHELRKLLNDFTTSFRRTPESSKLSSWTPAFAGVTTQPAALARRSGSLVRGTGSDVSKMVFDPIALRFPIAPRSMMQNNHRIKSSRPRSAQ